MDDSVFAICFVNFIRMIILCDGHQKHTKRHTLYDCTKQRNQTKRASVHVKNKLSNYCIHLQYVTRIENSIKYFLQIRDNY